MPACGPVRLIAGTPSEWSAIETSVALWCSPVARRTSSSRGSGSSVTAAARASSSSVVSPIADTTTTSWEPPARSRTILRATRLMRSAPATEEPPNFITTSGPGMARILAEGSGRSGRSRRWASARPSSVRSPPHERRRATNFGQRASACGRESRLAPELRATAPGQRARDEAPSPERVTGPGLRFRRPGSRDRPAVSADAGAAPGSRDRSGRGPRRGWCAARLISRLLVVLREALASLDPHQQAILRRRQRARVLRVVHARRVVGEVEVDRPSAVVLALDVQVASRPVRLAAARSIGERDEDRTLVVALELERRQAAGLTIDVEAQAPRPVGVAHPAVRRPDLERGRQLLAQRPQLQPFEAQAFVHRVVGQAGERPALVDRHGAVWILPEERVLVRAECFDRRAVVERLVVVVMVVLVRLAHCPLILCARRPLAPQSRQRPDPPERRWRPPRCASTTTLARPSRRSPAAPSTRGRSPSTPP